MRILFTGGGTGGHFFPIIAVADALRALEEKEGRGKMELYYAAPEPYDRELLKRYDIKFVRIPAGKIRPHFSFMNILDGVKTVAGIFIAFARLFFIYPDVVFGKGGYASFPTLAAARILTVPIMIHESDAVPGRVNRWADKFAARIAVSFPEAYEYFDKERTAYTGQPIRTEILRPIREGSHEYFGLKKDVPILLILGGSQGAQAINDAILDALPRLLERFQIIHQTGKKNFEDVKARVSVVFEKLEHKERYKAHSFLPPEAVARAAGIADLVISRAGSVIFEIAVWSIPAILIPIPETISHDQRSNAITYAKTGAAVIMEQENLTTNILLSELDRIFGDRQFYEGMRKAAQELGKEDAAVKIAIELVAIAEEHE